MTDSTMRALLDVHRTELNERDAELKKLGEERDFYKSFGERLQREAGDLRRKAKQAEDRASELRTDIEAGVERATKLQGVIDSLHLELNAERSAFSAYRDTHSKSEPGEQP